MFFIRETKDFNRGWCTYCYVGDYLSDNKEKGRRETEIRKEKGRITCPRVRRINKCDEK